MLTLVGCEAPSGDSATAAEPVAVSYRVPRTSWGDPDLAGVWPGTAMGGVPLQRDEKLGLRNVLTDEEFVAREAQSGNQLAQDNAEFDVETADTSNAGEVGRASCRERV